MVDQEQLRKKFFFAGLVIGTLLSGWYLYRLHGPRPAPGDPITNQLINVGLIYFAAIVQCRLLGRIVCWLQSRHSEQPGR
ncbi:MAG TPA: hypothetical protein VIU41_05160 [Geobacteraceae bacterium]